MSRIFSRGINGDLYASEVASAVRAWRLLDPDYALNQDAEWYEKVMRDGIVYMAVDKRSKAVGGSQYTFTAGGDTKEDRALAKIFTKIFKPKRIRESMSLLARAFIKGATFARKHMAFVDYQINGKTITVWSPVRLQDADKRRFRRIRGSFDMDREPTFRWEIHDPKDFTWKELDRTQWARHVYTNEEGALGSGRGLSAPLYFLHWFKTEALTHGMKFLDRWSEGMLIGVIDALMDGNFDDGDAESRAAQMLETLRRMRTHNIAVVGRGDDIKLQDAPGNAWDSVQQAIDYADNSIRALILGGVLPTGGGTNSVGSYAKAHIEQGSTDEIFDYDRGLLEETVQEELIEKFFNDNSIQWARLGLENAACPIFTIAKTRKQDAETRGQSLTTARQNSMAVLRKEAYRDLGWTDPGPDADPEEILPPIPTVLGSDAGSFGSFETPGISSQLNLDKSSSIVGDIIEDQRDVKPENETPIQGADVQETALNGGQIDSMKTIIESVSTGIIPPGSAKALIRASFPRLDQELIDVMIDNAASFQAPTPAAPAA